MKLCDTCTKTNCKKRIVIIQEDNLITTKCLDYEKDKNKIKGYKISVTNKAVFVK